MRGSRAALPGDAMSARCVHRQNSIHRTSGKLRTAAASSLVFNTVVRGDDHRVPLLHRKATVRGLPITSVTISGTMYQTRRQTAQTAAIDPQLPQLADTYPRVESLLPMPAKALATQCTAYTQPRRSPCVLTRTNDLRRSNSPARRTPLRVKSNADRRLVQHAIGAGLRADKTALRHR